MPLETKAGRAANARHCGYRATLRTPGPANPMCDNGASVQGVHWHSVQRSHGETNPQLAERLRAPPPGALLPLSLRTGVEAPAARVHRLSGHAIGALWVRQTAASQALRPDREGPHRLPGDAGEILGIQGIAAEDSHAANGAAGTLMGERVAVAFRPCQSLLPGGAQPPAALFGGGFRRLHARSGTRGPRPPTAHPHHLHRPATAGRDRLALRQRSFASRWRTSSWRSSTSWRPGTSCSWTAHTGSLPTPM